MPFDGSGTFQRVMNWTNDAAAGVKIKSDRHDQEDNNLASGLSNTLTRDGQSQPTANIPMNGKRLVNLGNPVDAQDAVTKGWMQVASVFTDAIWFTGPGIQSRLAFTQPDMSIIARKEDLTVTPNTKNRIAYNDKADGTGNDVFDIDENGLLRTRASDGKMYALARDTAYGHERNPIVNGAFVVSQENGDVAGTINGYALADQWRMHITGGTWTAARALDGGSQRYIGYLVNTNTAAPVSTSYMMIMQTVEGLRWPFRWGGSYPLAAVLNFKFMASRAGMYGCAIRKADGLRCITFEVPVQAGEVDQWKEFTFKVPPDSTVWNSYTSAGIGSVVISHTVGSTYKGGTPGEWGPGTFMGPASMTVNNAVNLNYMRIADVQLLPDPYGTGVAPPFVMAPYADDYIDSCRYFYRIQSSKTMYMFTSSVGSRYHVLYLPAVMRATPTVSGIVGSPSGTPAFSAAPDTINVALNGIADGQFSFSGLVADARM